MSDVNHLYPNSITAGAVGPNNKSALGHGTTRPRALACVSSLKVVGIPLAILAQHDELAHLRAQDVPVFIAHGHHVEIDAISQGLACIVRAPED